MDITIIRHSIRNRGGDKMVFEYAQYLCQQGHKIVYWTNDIVHQFPFNPKIEIKKIPYRGKVGTILFALSHKFQSQIVLVDIIAMALLVALRNSAEVIYLAQDYDVSYYSSKMMQNLVKFIYFLSFRIFKIPVIVESEALLNKIKLFHPPQYVINPVGIDLTHFNHSDNSKFHKYRSSHFVIILAVWNDYRKGIDIALKAINKLKKIRPCADWEIWTIGEQLPEIKNIKIKNFGFLNTDDLKEIFNASDIYIVSSRSEGLSTLLLQAMACGCAIVGTEAVNISNNFLQFSLISPVEDWRKLAQNLHYLMSDEIILKKLKINASTVALDYGLPGSCQKFEQALEQILQNKKDRSN